MSLPCQSAPYTCVAALCALCTAACAVGPNFKKPAAPEVSSYTARPPGHPSLEDDARLGRAARALVAVDSERRCRIHAEAGRGGAVGTGNDALHHLLRRSGKDRSARAAAAGLLSRSDNGRLGARPAR